MQPSQRSGLDPARVAQLALKDLTPNMELVFNVEASQAMVKGKETFLTSLETHYQVRFEFLYKKHF